MGKTGSGEIFRYDAIDSGQTFQAVIVCEEIDPHLLELLQKSSDLWLGGSQSAGYGHTRITDITAHENWNEVESPDIRTEHEDFTITLLSDLILRDERGHYAVIPPSSKQKYAPITKVLEAKLGVKLKSNALGVSLNEEDKQDKRHRITIIGVFSLASPLLIRSGQASSDRAPDVVHLKSKRSGSDDLKPILPGTSLAGVLRHRGERIINTLKQNINQNQNQDQNQNTNIINEIFGFSDENTKQAKASRLIVDEAEINNTTDLVQNRIAINRFTGGALYGALFDEQPIFGNDETRLVIKLELRQPKDSEIGLLLLLLKDLWTSDLPVGGTSSIGRGRLQGKHATINFDNKTWEISQDSKNKSLTVDGGEDLAKLEELEKFVAALHQEVSA
ncbi:RAMP superfamily CRISPR-associated protein [Mastigocoleus testarum]|uniref:CRISPR type III-associated protein domain-containing protein n=1 Tax=Mastigocoleus testarum BC008 TaxID=371196 RepID=A0A0V7ZN95_9CYAN|nr:RAMP superfamily CRISPR-associated protein [Mastigocoleus testarum]KST66165.1 hypothetical protein BC008_24645 [Mastigocoleus testarum BC008]